MKHIYCDKSTFEYEPKYEDSECPECFTVLGQSIINTPEFHKGPEEQLSGYNYKCLACGLVYQDYMRKILEITKAINALLRNLHKYT